MPMVTLSVCVQGWTATFWRCVSTRSAMWVCIYMSVFQCVLCSWIMVSNHVSTSVRVHAFFPSKFQDLEGCRVFLFLPTSQLVTAGFPQTIKNSRLPAALVITPPIRTKSEEEYQWVTRVRTTKLPEQRGLSFILAWTIPHHKPGSNSKGWNHSGAMDYNRYSIKIKLHTPQLWEVCKAKDPCWGENWMSN